MDTHALINFSTLKRAHRTRGGRIVIAFFSLLLTLYLLLFTPWGNLALKPLLEAQLSSLADTDITISDLKLRPKKFHIVCRDNQADTLNLHGGFSLLTLRMYGHYDLSFRQNGSLNPFPFEWKTSGALSGGIAAFDIMGRAVLEKGEAQYRMQLHRFKLSIIDLKTKALPAAPFIHLSEYPVDADAAIFANLHLSGIDKREYAGNLALRTKTARFSPTKILKDDTNESFSLRKLLADEQGNVKPFKIDLTADISLDEAGIIEQFARMPLRGNADLEGFIRGDDRSLILHAHSALSHSATSSTITMENLEPSRILLTMRHADIASLFHLFALNAPLRGSVNARADLAPAGGAVTLELIDAVTVPKVLKEEYNLTQPLTRFNASVSANLDQKNVHYRGMFKSDLSRMHIDSTATHDQMLRDLLKMIR